MLPAQCNAESLALRLNCLFSCWIIIVAKVHHQLTEHQGLLKANHSPSIRLALPVDGKNSPVPLPAPVP
jgi:hypothetical protein